MKTLKNKVLATTFMSVGYASIFIENDITFFVIATLVGLPVFFAKENIVS